MPSILENTRMWTTYDWPQDGDEWSEFATDFRETYPEWKRALVNRFLQPHLKPNAVVLEVGCGHGRWSQLIHQKVKKFYVVDLLAECLDYTRRRLNDNKNTYIQTYGPMPQIGDGEVDFIWSFDVFVHIELGDTGVYFKEFGRVLKRGGKAVIHTPDDSRHGGYRSQVTASDVRATAGASGLRTLFQTDNWGRNGQFHVKKHRDIISMLAKQ